MKTHDSRPIWIAAALAWILPILFGLIALAVHDSSPGIEGDSPVDWPDSSKLPRDPHRTRLVLMLHPKCPCSDASLDELERILDRAQGKLETTVLFVRPQEMPWSWARTPTWRKARALPGVSVFEDLDGRESTRFGAFTSGQALLYDASGKLLYHGGVTGGRGMCGPNPGSESILAHLEGLPPKRVSAGVFGCSLFHKKMALSSADATTGAKVR